MDLTERNLEILRLVNHYRFLTVPQLKRLGIAGTDQSVTRMIRRFPQGKEALLGTKDYYAVGSPTAPRHRTRKLARIHYLKPAGARLLQELYGLEEDELHALKSAPPFLQDYHHRVATIGFRIELDRFCEQRGWSVRFFHGYFDKQGANRSNQPQQPRLTSRTRIPLSEGFFIPDGIFLVEDDQGKERLFTLEVHNGLDTKRTFRQLLQHRQALAEGAVALAYGLKLPWRVLSVYETANALEAEARRIAQSGEFTGYGPYFALHTLEGVQEGLNADWRYVDGAVGGIFG